MSEVVDVKQGRITWLFTGGAMVVDQPTQKGTEPIQSERRSFKAYDSGDVHHVDRSLKTVRGAEHIAEATVIDYSGGRGMVIQVTVLPSGNDVDLYELLEGLGWELQT